MVAEPTMAVMTWLNGHPQAKACPLCGDDLSTVGLLRLAYVFADCGCERAAYPHLVEQLWHLNCLVQAAHS